MFIFFCLFHSVLHSVWRTRSRNCTVCTLLLWKLLIIIKQTFRIVGHKSWGQVRWLYRFTHLCQRHNYIHSFTHTHTRISIRTLTQIITKLISKQIFRILWTCPNGTRDLLTLSLCLSISVSPIFILSIHVLTCCEVWAKVICQVLILSMKAIGIPHTGSLSESKFSWRTKTLTCSGSHVARQPPRAAPLWAPYLIPLCQSCCWQHSAGLKNSTSILCDAP